MSGSRSVDSVRDHDKIRDAFCEFLNQFDNHQASIERWVEDDSGDRTRVDVLSKRAQWDGLEQKEVKYGYEIKRNTGSANNAHKQLKIYKDAGVVPVAVFPHPSRLRYGGEYGGLIETAESNVLNGRLQAGGVVYYGPEMEIYAYDPRRCGLNKTDVTEVGEPLYAPDLVNIDR